MLTEELPCGYCGKLTNYRIRTGEPYCNADCANAVPVPPPDCHHCGEPAKVYLHTPGLFIPFCSTECGDDYIDSK
jgi:endogenous inhibitor of DNA gyrase (YacG/DUF329 family)